MAILQPHYQYIGIITNDPLSIQAEFMNRVGLGPFSLGKGTLVREDEKGVQKMWSREMKDGNLFSYFNRSAISDAYSDIRAHKKENGIPFDTEGLAPFK